MKRYATVRMNRRFAPAARSNSHADALHARTENRCARGERSRAICDAPRPRTDDSTTPLRS
eukprot:8693791-Lingulodinium_polyedra.AAC.1